MKSYVMLVALICTIHSVNAQSFKKYWNDGPLKWEDFQEINSIEFHGELKHGYDYKYKKAHIKKGIHGRYNALKIYVDRETSWVKPDSKTDDLLKYFQVQFDMLEYYGRKAQKQLLEPNLDYYDTRQAVENNFNLYQQEYRYFKEYSKYGTDRQVIDEFSEKYRKKLSEIDTTITLIIPDAGGFGYGIGFGHAQSYYSGSLSNYYYSAYGFYIDWVFLAQPVVFMPDINCLFTAYQNDYLKNGKVFIRNQPVTEGIFNFKFGFNSSKNQLAPIVPYLGLSIHNMSRDSINHTHQTSNITDVKPCMGFVANIPVKRWYANLGNLYGRSERGFSHIQVKFNVTQNTFFPEIKGYTYTLGVGFQVFGRLCKNQN
jgi:hypothetical protein